MTEDLLKNASIESAQEVENVQTSENPTQIESANETSAPQNQNDEKPTQPKKKFQLGDVAKCTIVLTVIALVAGLLLGIVNWVTYVDPDGVIADQCTAYFASETSVKDEKLASYDYDKNNYVESCFVAKTATKSSDIAITRWAAAQRTARLNCSCLSTKTALSRKSPSTNRAKPQGISTESKKQTNQSTSA